MKPTATCKLVFGIFAIFQAMLETHANQTISLPSSGGTYIVGCEVSGPGGNSITNKAFLDPSQLPDGSEFGVFQCGGDPTNSDSFQIYYSDSQSPSGWDDGAGNPLATNVVWNAGEGVLITPAAPTTLTLIGTNPTPVLPPTNYCGCGTFSLLSVQNANVVGSYQNVTGFSPVYGAQVYIFTGSGYQVYTYSNNGTWSPATPILSSNSAAFYYVPCQGCPTITLNPGTLPNGTEGAGYNQAITASGGAGPYSFSITSSNKPPGLNLSSTGTLNGIPTTPGVTTFTVTATDTNGCTGSRTYSFTNNCANIILNPPSLPNGTEGAGYNQAITAFGGAGPYSFSITSGNKPPGLNLSSTGTLSGIPSTPGVTTFTVTATDTNGCTGSRIYSFTNNCPNITLSPTSLPNGSQGIDYSQTITASGGAGPYTFSTSSTTEPPGLNLASNGVLSGTPTTPGATTFTVTATDTNGCTGNWTYTLTVTNDYPLTLVSTYIICDDTNLIAAFSNPLATGVATNSSNYQVSFGGQTFNVVASSQFGSDPRLLTIALPVSPAELVGNYALSVSGVKDVYGSTFTQTNIPILCATNNCNYASSGTQFWLTFPGNYAPDPNNPPAVELYITGAPGVVGSVSIPGFSPPFVSSFTVPPLGTVSVTLPSTADLGNANDVIETNGIEVVASQPVTVDAFDHVPYTSDAYLGLPVHTLGNSYVVMAYKNVYTNIPDLNGSQFAIVAAANNTTVTIDPPVQVDTHPPNTPFNIKLTQGETYQLRDTSNAPTDLTGTTIVSTQPIAVFGGHQCASVPVADAFFCDYLVQQLLPVTLWGTNFLTVPFATRLDGDTFRCLAWQTNTTVSTNGNLAGTINAGQFLEFQLGVASHITSSAPIQVAQFADSSDYDGVENADPLMCLIPPTTLYANAYQLVIPPESYFPSSGNYLNILTPTANTVNVDGSSPPVTFTALGSTGYSWAQVPVNPGTHTVISTGGMPIGVTTYGWSVYDAYGYPAGICAQTNGATPEFTCPTNLIQTTVQSSNSYVAVPNLTTNVGNAAAALMITQSPTNGTLVKAGVYQITITIVDRFNQIHLCQSEFIVTVQAPVVVSVSMSTSGTISLIWSQNAILQASPTPLGPWTNISTATSPYSITPVYKQSFYRTVLP